MCVVVARSSRLLSSPSFGGLPPRPRPLIFLLHWTSHVARHVSSCVAVLRARDAHAWGRGINLLRSAVFSIPGQRMTVLAEKRGRLSAHSSWLLPACRVFDFHDNKFFGPAKNEGKGRKDTTSKDDKGEKTGTTCIAETAASEAPSRNEPIIPPQDASAFLLCLGSASLVGRTHAAFTAIACDCIRGRERDGRN